MKFARTCVVVLASVLAAGCSSLPQPEVAPSAVPELPPPPPEPAPAPPPPSAPQVEALPRSAEMRSQAAAFVADAIRHLLDGDDGRARPALERAVELDPANTTGSCLLRAMTVDPLELLGRASRPYVVRAGETIQSIGHRAFHGACGFYLIARYNGLGIPRQLRAGMTIRVPGTAALHPPASMVQPQPRPAEATASSVPVAPAAAPPETGPRKTEVPPAPTREASLARAEVHYRNGAEAFRRQDLLAAISEWRQVLAHDPTHPLAPSRLKTATELCARSHCDKR